MIGCQSRWFKQVFMMFTARSFNSVFLLIGLFLFPVFFSTKALSYFYSDNIPAKITTSRVNSLTLTDQMKIYETYNQDHTVRKNEVSVRWVSKNPIVLNACFRHPFGLYNIPPSRPPVSVVGSTVNDHLNPTLSSVTSDNHEHYYYFSVRLNLKETGHITLSGIDTSQWVLDSDCSGILTDDDRRISSRALVSLYSAAPPDDEQDESGWSAPFQATPVDQSQSGERGYSSGGGQDDSDDDFKKKPGGSFRPFAFFEYTSKLGVNLLPMATTHGNTLRLRHKYAFRVNVVLTVFQNGNAREVIIPPDLWIKIRSFGRYLDPQLALRLAQNPFDPEQAYLDYLRESSEQSFPYTEDYRHWLLEKLPDLIPVKVSIFPESAPIPVGHPNGGTTKGSNYGGFTASNKPSQSGGYNEYGQWSTRPSGGGGNDGDGGNEKQLTCNTCGKELRKLIRGHYHLCGRCYGNALHSPVLQEDALPNIETQRPGHTPQLVFTSTPQEIRLYRWLQFLPEEEIAGTLLTLGDYRQEILYQELCLHLSSKPELTDRLAKKMAEVAAGSANMKDLLITVGELVSQNSLDRNKVVSKLLLTIARYPSRLLKSQPGISSEDRVQQLRDQLALHSYDQKAVDSAALHPVSEGNKDKMRTNVYSLFQELTKSMGTVQIPVTERFLQHLNSVFEQLFENFFFGMPISESSNEMDMWGVSQEQKFMGGTNGQDLSIPRTINLLDLPTYLKNNNVSEQHGSNLYLAGVVLGYGLNMLNQKELPDNLQTVLLTFLSEVQKNLRDVLDENAESGRLFTHYMLSVFGFNVKHFLNTDILKRFDLQPLAQQASAAPTCDSRIEDRVLIHKIQEELCLNDINQMIFLMSFSQRVGGLINKSDSPQLEFFKHWSERSDYTYRNLMNILEMISRIDLITMITRKYPWMEQSKK